MADEEYSKVLKKFHKLSDRHILVVETDMSYSDVIKVVALSDKIRKAGNELVGLMKKNHDQLMRTKKYRKLRELYGGTEDKDKRKDLARQLNEMQAEYNITWDFCRISMIPIGKKYGIDAIFALTKAEDVWRGIEKCLYGNGKSIHFSQYGELPCIRAKQINRGITLVPKIIRGKYRVYLHLTIEGKAKPKYDKFGNPRHKYGKGIIGADIGTQTVAYTSDTEVGLKNLSERGNSIQKSEHLERLYYRAMDRSRRTTNPQNYNPDGTDKKGRKTWKYSNHYKKIKAKHSELCRINAVNRQLAINEDTNHLRSLGDVFVTEPKNAGKLMKRAKETTINSKGKFNVPFGRNLHPTICNTDTILADSELLNRVDVTILNGDFERTGNEIQEGLNFFYFDPPYRPLNATSSFNSYAKEEFNDDEQIRLRDFCARLDEHPNVMWMLSNSDCSAKNPNDTFFEAIYDPFNIHRVHASRAINANPEKRGKLTELLIKNYE